MAGDYKSWLLKGTSYSSPSRVRVGPEDPLPFESMTSPPPLGHGERGLVVSVPAVLDSGGGLLIKESELDQQELRAALLLWDRLDFPTSNTIHIEPGLDESFLINEGIMVRSDVKFGPGSGDAATAFVAAHVMAFQIHEMREPGRWSLARGEQSLSFPARDVVEGAGLHFELHRCIPVPDKAVALPEILQFKERRRAELQALRGKIDETVAQIAQAPDLPLELAAQRTRLAEALADHMKVAKEWRFPFRLTTIRAGFSWDISTPAVVGGLALYAGLPVLESLVLAGASSLPKLALKTDIGLRDRPQQNTPFEYVSAFHHEVFGR